MRRYLVLSVIGLTAIMVAGSWWREPARLRVVLPSSMVSAIPSTTRRELLETLQQLERHVAVQPEDGDAVVRLAQTLVRLQRVNSDAAAAVAAERHLRGVLARQPDHYAALRELGSVLLSQHRFRDALVAAQRARSIDPADAWNYGVIGDAHLELGNYEEAFAAFDRMGALKPGPAAYARVAYALELKGDLDAALESMQMAADGTSAHDAEAQAWHYAQLGNLLLQKGRAGAARREFERAAATFPDHPYAAWGLARIKIVEADFAGALQILSRAFAHSATPELAFVLGDLHRALGDDVRGEAMYVEGERLEREGWEREEPQPQALARFLAERGRKLPEAVALAERAVTMRRDVHSMDALAWAYFRVGRLSDAVRASEDALRTGTRDARILAHAAAIRGQAGDMARAQDLLSRAAVPLPDVTLLLDKSQHRFHGLQ
jgi:tetratricopeptide (TPR) repeat protein